MIIAAADGSSLSNPGPSGWAWYIDDDHWHAGGWPKGTNNKGELYAVLDLLRSTAHLPDEPLKILCDSQYVINAVTKWMPGWKRKGWKKADGQPVLNQDLLKALDEALVGRDVSFEWVKGHAGHAMNEAADERARAAATAYRDGTAVEHGPGFGSVEAAEAAVLEEIPVASPAAAAQPAARPAAPALSAQGQPRPTSATEFDPGIQTVIGYEKELLSDKVRSDPMRVRELLHPQFSEFGAALRAGGHMLLARCIDRLTEGEQGEVFCVTVLLHGSPPIVHASSAGNGGYGSSRFRAACRAGRRSAGG